jgi:hypothetical protein
MKYKVYKDYKFYENGDIESPNGRFIKPYLTPKGYHLVRIKLDGKWTCTLVHTIVAKAWLGEPLTGFEVDHKNNIRTDNRVSNLQYLTKSENNRKAYLSGNRDVSGFKNANCKVNPTQVYEVCELIEKGLTNQQCFTFTSVCKTTIGKIRSGKSFREISNLFQFSSRFRD